MNDDLNNIEGFDEGYADKNIKFRRVGYLVDHSHLVVMALKPKEEIGADVNDLDQFIRVEESSGEAVLNGVWTTIRAGFAAIVSAGKNYNIINTGDVPLKIYTLFVSPNHRDGGVHQLRAEAEAGYEHFADKSTEE